LVIASSLFLAAGAFALAYAGRGGYYQ
jgi:hypothetical protein